MKKRITLVLQKLGCQLSRRRIWWNYEKEGVSLQMQRCPI